ncbi:ISSod4, transposase, interruption [Salmonella enterica subsp. enterica serovar Agona str. 12.A.06]|nr:ISSod4, transposase, interruption [Salmonella enterica subsp. enterica serovar Agona str. 12.A.06]
MWLSGNEGTKFWLSVLTELKKRGLQDILIACVDSLKSGHPDCLCGRSEGLPGCDKQRLPEISANQQKLACALGKPQYALQLSAGYPQDHLPSTLQTQSNP